VGCAGSRDLETWTQKGITYYGVDYSAKMIELSIAKAERIGALGCHFKRANLLDMEIVPASVSLVWCSSVIQHVPKGLVSNVLTNFHDALEPGGILYLNVRPPKEGVPIEGMVTSKEYTRTDGQRFVERFVAHYEMNEMTTLLERIGFTVEGGEMYAEVYNQYNDGGEKAAYLPEKFVIFARKNNVIA
jgi:SAM-dependent methyltransferase